MAFQSEMCLRVLFVFLFVFCIGFTVSYFVAFAIKNPDLEAFSTADGDMRLVVFRQIKTDRLSLKEKKETLESVIQSCADGFKTNGDKFPYLFFRNEKVKHEFDGVMDKYNRIKAGYETNE